MTEQQIIFLLLKRMKEEQVEDIDLIMRSFMRENNITVFDPDYRTAKKACERVHEEYCLCEPYAWK